MSLDILRGFALLGMLLVHFHDKSTEPGGIDDAVRIAIWRLVEGKSHGTFALLFGAGFAILLRRAEMSGRPFTPFYLRRLGVLALFGFAAHAFFGFNVLLGYAVWGVPLLFIRTWSTRALVALAIASTISVGLYHLAYGSVLSMQVGSAAADAVYQARFAQAREVNAALDAAGDQSSYLVLLGARLRHMAWFHTQPFFFLPGATLTLFIAGMLFVRHQVFDDPPRHKRLLMALSIFGVVSWTLDNWVMPTMGLLRDQWLMFMYVSAALWLLASRPALVPRLWLFANAGRMALTNYLIQIAAIDLLFSGYALGLGTIRPLAGPVMAVTLFAAEAAFSTLWLRRCRFGPAEWLWRSLTYGRRQPMRVSAAPFVVS